MVVKYGLAKEFKGEEIADRIVKAFEEIEKNEVETYTTGFFKKKAKTRSKYRLKVNKDYDYTSGDSGPKEVLKELELEFGLAYLDACDRPLFKEKVRIKVKGQERIGNIDIECLVLDNENKKYNLVETKSDQFKNRRFDQIVKLAVDTLHKALYGSAEESTKGASDSEKIL